MQRAFPLLAAITTLCAAAAPQALVIDTFTVAQSLSSTALARENFNQVVGAEPLILGGERDGYLLLDLGTAITADVGGGTIAHREAPGSDGQLFYTWDGPDDAPTTDRLGLGGLDFTEGGSLDAFSLEILLSPLASTNLGFLAYTNLDDYSMATFSAPAGASTQTVMFSDFITQGAGAGVDFTNIGALSFFTLTAVPGQTMDFGTLQTIAAPEPASAPLLSLGLGLLAARSRRRRRSGAYAMTGACPASPPTRTS